MEMSENKQKLKERCKQKGEKWRGTLNVLDGYCTSGANYIGEEDGSEKYKPGGVSNRGEGEE